MNSKAAALILSAMLTLGCGGNGTHRSTSTSTGAGVNSNTGPATLSLAPLSATLPGGSVGATYSATVTATGGSGGYTWDVTGSLPPGLVPTPGLGSQALTLSGTPTTAGIYSFTVAVLDSSSASSTRAYGVTVDPAPVSVSDTWAAIRTVAAPSPRSRHTAVWTGSELIVWGGNDGTKALAGGGAYDPQTDSWRPIRPAPVARAGHTAVWTGTEMIVFGGGNPSLAGGGGAYDPATDTWRPIVVGAGTPEPRSLHAAVWTGSRMLVFGGEGAWPPGVPFPNSMDRVFQDGFAYDPTTDTWTQFLTPGGGQRRGHTGVYTGSEMIVWGGRDAYALTIRTLQTGGRYHVATNTWQATGLTAAPAARTGHTAVWTGSTMLVWGGATGIGVGGVLDVTNSGALFDPSNGGWSPFQLTGAPIARSGHSAVWTGSEMIVWGGTTGSGATDTGGVQDSAGVWRAVTTANAPAARSGHSAVWTGSRLLVWGGLDATGSVLGSGGSYSP